MKLSAKYKENTLLFASVIIPSLNEDESLKEQFWNDFQAYFLALDIDVQNQLQLLVKAISALSIVYTFKGFNRLSFEQRKKYISRLFHFPIPMFVSGLTGLRSLFLFTYYTNETQWKKIKYNGPIQ